jgi:hypothetical protein
MLARDYIKKPFPPALVPLGTGGWADVNLCYPIRKSEEFAAILFSSCVQMACRMDVFNKAKQLGIQTEFVDGQGHPHVTDAVALKTILDALGEPVPYRFLSGPVADRNP